MSQQELTPFQYVGLLSCPICAPIIEAIGDANNYSTLLDIRRRRIPHAIGITADQRAMLVAAVTQREDALSRPLK